MGKLPLITEKDNGEALWIIWKLDLLRHDNDTVPSASIHRIQTGK